MSHVVIRHVEITTYITWPSYMCTCCTYNEMFNKKRREGGRERRERREGEIGGRERQEGGREGEEKTREE